MHNKYVLLHQTVKHRQQHNKLYATDSKHSKKNVSCWALPLQRLGNGNVQSGTFLEQMNNIFGYMLHP